MSTTQKSGEKLDYGDYAICYNCSEYNHKTKWCKEYRETTTPLKPGCGRGKYNQIHKDTIKKSLNQQKKTEQKKEDDTIQTSLIINKEKKVIIEQIHDKGKNQYCIYNHNTQEIRYENEYIHDSITHKPINAEEINKGAIHLPTKAEEYNNDTELDQEILTFINTWLDIPKDIQQFGLWNIKRSWVYERFHTLNYLRALGDTGLGKSRFLDTLGYLHYKPIATSGATTSAPIFRIIDKWRGSLIMDEADFKTSDESADIIKIINSGYEKGKYVMRCDQNDAKKIQFFDAYCPKLLGTRKSFQDKAVESRCITHVMGGTTRQDIPLNINSKFWDGARQLRNKLLMWRFRNYFEIDSSVIIDYESMGLSEIEPRLKQIVSSFICLFMNDESQLEVFKNLVIEKQSEIIEERRNSFEGTVISAIHGLIKDEKVLISASDIIEKGNITNSRGIQIKARSLNSCLKGLGFGKSRVQKVDGRSKRVLPLDDKHLNNLFKRYGYEVTKVTVVMESSDNNLKIKEEVVGYGS